MAKRFIDTGLFDDEWFSELDPECKMFWIYYLTKCDHAGLLKYNKKLIEFQTGIKSLERVIELLGNRLVRVNELLFFCPKFIVFQYPGFPKSGVKQQQGAISLLINSGLWDEKQQQFKELINSKVTLAKVLPKTYGNGNDIGNGNVTGHEGKISDFEEWGKLIVSGSDYHWEQMRGRKISSSEMDSFISVAVRNNWKMPDQHSFRVTLKGFKVNGNDHKKPQTGLQL